MVAAPIDRSKRTRYRQVNYQPRARHFLVNPYFLLKQETRVSDWVTVYNSKTAEAPNSAGRLAVMHSLYARHVPTPP